jgi:Fe-S oxidoreductase
LKAAIAVAPQRRLPLLASRSFRAWFAARPKHNAERSEVVLWPDTWNNYFHPATAQAAVEVLEDAGYRVTIPRVALCCGRPLYDYGMLDVAKRWLQRALEELRPLIRAGVPVIGLEPSCVSVFREEMVNLLGDDEDAKRLKLQTFLLTEFLARKTEYRPPPLARHALVHQHCHHKSVLDKSAEAELYDRMQLDYTIPDSGCCGMAGPFGFEAKHYAVSMAIGERVLLPRVRDCSAHTIVVADGFSCREQIAQATKRQALHPAQLLKMAIDDRGAERDDALPERRYMPDPGAERARASRNALITGAGMLLTASVLRAAWRRSR